MLTIIPEGPALLLKKGSEKTLITPDLHLGYEKALAKKGINMPSQNGKIFARLRSLIKRYNPGRLIFLGDIKHGTSRILPHEWTDVPQFFEKLLTEVDEIYITPGNHDGGLKSLLPSSVTVGSPHGLLLTDNVKQIYLMHGHTWPSPEAFRSDILVMGHHHFTVELKEASRRKRKEPVWVVTRYDTQSVIASYLQYRNIKGGVDPMDAFRIAFQLEPGRPKVIVMPTFNRMLSGSPLNSEPPKEYLGPIFRTGRIDPTESEIFLLDGTYIKLPISA